MNTKQAFFTLLFFSLNSFADGFFGIDVFHNSTYGIGLSGGTLVSNTSGLGIYADVKASGLGIKDSGISYNLAKNGFRDQETG